MQSTGHSELDARLVEVVKAMKYPGMHFRPVSVVCALAFIAGSLNWLPKEQEVELKRRQDILRPDIKNFALIGWLEAVAFPDDMDLWGATDQRVHIKDELAVAKIAAALSSLIDKSQVGTA